MFSVPQEYPSETRQVSRAVRAVSWTSGSQLDGTRDHVAPKQVMRGIFWPREMAKKEILVRYILTTKTTGEWIARLRQVPCAPVNDPASALSDPFMQERQMIVETDHPEFGRIRHVAGPMKIAGARKKNPHRAPKFGEHPRRSLKNSRG